MKLIKSYLAVACAVAVGSGAFAASVPTDSANSANTGVTQAQLNAVDAAMQKHMDQCNKKIQQAARKDAKQDAQGQRKLDEEWAKLLRAQGIDPNDPNSPPDPFVYEGSAKDMRQDQKLTDKLNKYLVKHGCPPVSSID